MEPFIQNRIDQIKLAINNLKDNSSNYEEIQYQMIQEAQRYLTELEILKEVISLSSRTVP